MDQVKGQMHYCGPMSGLARFLLICFIRTRLSDSVHLLFVMFLANSSLVITLLVQTYVFLGIFSQRKKMMFGEASGNKVPKNTQASFYAWMIHRSTWPNPPPQRKNVSVKTFRYKQWTEKPWKTFRKFQELLLKATLKNCLPRRRICGSRLLHSTAKAKTFNLS